MEEKEFLREKEKLKEVVEKLKTEEKNLENSLTKTNSNYEKDSFVRAHIVYLSEKKISDLKKVRSKPYFARIDFNAKGEKQEKFYIGKISILDSETQKPIIIDWRAPISNLYYDRKNPENLVMFHQKD